MTELEQLLTAATECRDAQKKYFAASNWAEKQPLLKLSKEKEQAKVKRYFKRGVEVNHVNQLLMP